jgi:hypothetical protein
MAFKRDMPAAARRHLLAANILNSGDRRDVAGYLYGIAAECALKAMMVDAGLRPLPVESRRDDPFFAHFPELRTMLRDTLKGRRGTTLIALIGDDSFMTQWSTDMRYAHGSDILMKWVDNWAAQASRAVTAIGT